MVCKISRKVYSVRQANAPNRCGQAFCKMGHTVSRQGPDGVRKQYHNELSENKVMEGKIGGKAFRDVNFGFFSSIEGIFLQNSLNEFFVECAHILLECPLNPVTHWCLLLSDSTPSCSSATSNILLLFFTFVLCSPLPVPLRLHSKVWLHASSLVYLKCKVNKPEELG